jgi:hypothetical protein
MVACSIGLRTGIEVPAIRVLGTVPSGITWSRKTELFSTEET